MKQLGYGGHYQTQDRPHQRHKFTDAGDQTKHQRTRYSQQRKPDCADHTNEEAGCKLGTNISSQGAIDVLKKFVAAPAPAAARQQLPGRTSESFDVLEKE